MIKTLLTAFATILFFSGCMTYQPTRTAQANQTQDRLIEQENQRRMAGRVETLEREIDRISRELDSLQKNIDVRVANIERKSEEDKRELIARLSAQLDKLVTQTPAPAAVQSTSGGAVQGYEHIVQQGETLSTIAKAYNVTTKAIIQANKIKNPDRLSIGQKLFVPE